MRGRGRCTSSRGALHLPWGVDVHARGGDLLPAGRADVALPRARRPDSAAVHCEGLAGVCCVSHPRRRCVARSQNRCCSEVGGKGGAGALPFVGRTGRSGSWLVWRSACARRPSLQVARHAHAVGWLVVSAIFPVVVLEIIGRGHFYTSCLVPSSFYSTCCPLG